MNTSLCDLYIVVCVKGACQHLCMCLYSSQCHQTVRKLRMWLVCDSLYHPFSPWTRSIVVCIPPRSNEKSFYSVYRKPIHNSVSNNQEKKAVSVVIDVYCYCRCPDDGSKMVLCDGACGQWYHLNCLKQKVSQFLWVD